ncbi:hypothetical protein M0P25_00315 [archaeon]|nr:hypothetical protein [archaeon]
MTPNGKQFAVSSFKQWLYNKKFVKDYEVGLINKLSLLFVKEQKHTYTFSELSDIIKIKLEQINEDKYLNRLVRQILNYLLESDIVSDNDVSYIKKKLKTKQYNADNYVPTDYEIQQTLLQLTLKNLKEMGLNEKELSQFKEYWIPELNGSKYYVIKLLSDDFLSENMNLLVSPTPDTMIRLNFYFKGVDNIVKLEEPVITTPVRNGFTVVEWGGILEE